MKEVRDVAEWWEKRLYLSYVIMSILPFLIALVSILFSALGLIGKEGLLADYPNDSLLLVIWLLVQNIWILIFTAIFAHFLKRREIGILTKSGLMTSFAVLLMPTIYMCVAPILIADGETLGWGFAFLVGLVLISVGPAFLIGCLIGKLLTGIKH